MASRKKTTQSLRWRICKTTRIRDIALRNGTLENPSQCEGFGRGHCHLHSSISNIRHCNIYSLQPDAIHCTRHLQKTSTPALKASVLFFFIIELLSVPYELQYDEPLESQPTLRKYFLQLLNHRIQHRQYVEYPRQLLYYG